MEYRLASFFLAVVLLASGANFATAQVPVFGPETYIRATGKPHRITKRFSIQNPDAAFTLIVQNGEGKRGRVSSAIIEPQKCAKARIFECASVGISF